jgi:hypothetical protein
VTTTLPGRAPSTDTELVRSFHDRIRKLETAPTVRVGPWVLSNDAATGALRATRPGQVVLIDGEGATELDPVKVDLSGLVTNTQLDHALAGVGGLPDLGAIAESIFGSLYTQLTGFLNPVSALTQLANFFKLELGGAITPGRLPLIPLSHIRNVQPNLLVDGSFDDENTLAGFPDWDYDEADGKSRPGCAYTVADGTTHTLHSNPIEVGADDTLDVEAWAKWTGLTTSAPNPITVAVASYTAAGVLIGGAPAVLTNAGGSGGTVGWTGGTIFTNWDVPNTAAYVVLELTVANTATAGTVKFDDLVVRKTGTLPQSYVTGLVGALGAAAQGIQDLINQIWTGITRQVLDGPKALPDLWEVLGDIPAFSIGGVGGLTNMADTITQTWTQLWGGFAQAIGAGGKSIADAANAAGNVASTADQAQDLAEWTNAVQGIRNNKPFDSGMDPTAVSMFPIPAATASGGEPPYLNATSASVPMAFWIAPEDAQRGSIQWLGKGNANITALYIDVYRLNTTTGAATLIHTSPDQFPKLTAGLKLIRYDMATADRIAVAHADVLGFAWRVTGTGTHQVAMRYGLATGDTTQVPQRPSAVRTGTLVGNMAAGAVPYGGDVPWVAFGIVTGDVAPPFFNPRTTEFATPGAGQVYDIPTWANYLDIVLIGGGGGGRGGNGGNTIAGQGGFAGQWRTETLVRGVDFPANASQVILDIGTGGNAGGKEQAGQAGTVTVRRAIVGGKAVLTAPAGNGGQVEDNNLSAGGSPGDITFGGKPYVGGIGGVGGRPGSNASAPGAGGGGGYGGIYTVGYAGGNGGRGGGWVTARAT